MTGATNCKLRFWSAVIHHRFGLRRSRFAFDSVGRLDQRKVAPRQKKAAMNRRTPKEGRR